MSRLAGKGLTFERPFRSALRCMLAGLALACASSGCRTPGGRVFESGRPVRAVWVTRWDYKKPADIAAIMENCRRAGFNHVLFQVRGNGTAFYRSRLEPWAPELGGRDPGFDPLRVACREAHRRNLRIHAWVNVIPGWRGDKPPGNPRQLYLARADWFWRDAQGRREPLGWYSNLNPCYPEVRRYLVDVMGEIVGGYPVDGLHLDYVRFPNEWNDAYPPGAHVPDYPRDARTVGMFQQRTGRLPDQAPGLWDQWRTEQITRLVGEIRAMMRHRNPRAALSAAVGAVPEESRRRHYQDVHAWMSHGLVDAVFPMNYESSVEGFRQRLGAWRSSAVGVPVVMGIMFDRRDPALVIQQVEAVRQATPHFSAFAYNSLFERLDGRGRPIVDGQSAARAALRQQVLPVLRRQRMASLRGSRD